MRTGHARDGSERTIRTEGVSSMHRRAFLATALAGAATASVARASTFELPPRFQAQVVPIRGGWAAGRHPRRPERASPLPHPPRRPGDPLRRRDRARRPLRDRASSRSAPRRNGRPGRRPRTMIEREPEKYAQYEDGMPGGADEPARRACALPLRGAARHVPAHPRHAAALDHRALGLLRLRAPAQSADRGPLPARAARDARRPPLRSSSGPLVGPGGPPRWHAPPAGRPARARQPVEG